MDLTEQVNSFLTNLLTHFRPYLLTDDDKKKNKLSFIVGKLTRKKFRRRKLVDKTKQAITEKVQLSIQSNEPIHLVVPFGGYKHFWNPSHPEPDWAEIFNFKYLTEFVSPILSVYKPGVIIEYISEDLILTRMNNYPQSALEKYSDIFRKLIEWYGKKIPTNLKFKFFRVKEHCNSQKLIKQVESLLIKRKVEFENLSLDRKIQELHRSNRSLMWQGEKDLTTLTDQEKKQRIIESRLIELAYYETEAKPEFLGNYLSENNHICICFSYGTTHDNDEFEDLTIGSSYGSIVDYWIGRGIFYKRGERLIPDIISRNQYELIKKDLKIVGTKNILPYKNYQNIEVLIEV